MRNLRERPIVEVERAGETHRYRAVVVEGPHPAIDARLREKYGVADRWVRFVMPDDESAAPVRLGIRLRDDDASAGHRPNLGALLRARGAERLR
jgi:hypothetical protein